MPKVFWPDTHTHTHPSSTSWFEKMVYLKFETLVGWKPTCQCRAWCGFQGPPSVIQILRFKYQVQNNPNARYRQFRKEFHSVTHLERFAAGSSDLALLYHSHNQAWTWLAAWASESWARQELELDSPGTWKDFECVLRPRCEAPSGKFLRCLWTKKIQDLCIRCIVWAPLESE